MTLRDAVRIGFHVSIAGGFALAVERAYELGCNTMQIFSRNPRGWKVKPMDESDIHEFRRLREKYDIDPVFVHTNYLINLASDRQDLHRTSIEHFVIDLERTERLGAEYLVTHLGSARGRSEEWMIDRVAYSLNTAMRLHKPEAVILLENTAGEAGDIGFTLAQIRDIISMIDDASHIGICYDTCHGFAAGYDIRNDEGVDALAAEIDSTVGLDRLKAIHLNDSLRGYNSRVDRHWHIGGGRIGSRGFSAMLHHPAFEHVPKIMETPKESEEDDPRNMKTVRRLLKGGTP